MYPFGAPEDSSTRGASGKTSGRHLKIHVFRRLLKFLASKRSSAKVDLGDRRLEEARNLAREYEALISARDLQAAETKFTMTMEMKVGLGSKSGISKLLQAREYCKCAKDALRYVECQAEVKLSPSTSPRDREWNLLMKVDGDMWGISRRKGQLN
ncbi:hypothetical protein BC826DRAFT_381492 [Russula brevipes]|nr:hypothetical protein BC826DRAFT_381492 [Russula brevipes]